MDVPIATQVLETPQLTPTHDQVRVFFMTPQSDTYRMA
jgi:hypothetical protein